MIVMWISIRERAQEIGTLRAIGMQQTSVLLMFFGVLLSLGLNAAHVPLPVGVQFVLLSDKLVVLPTAQWVVATVLFITLVVTVISIIPSFIAARLKPVTAMQHAG